MTAPEAPRIVTGSVYAPPEEAYPRVLVMRRWPRGVAKGAVDQWERELGPSDELLEGYRAERLSWEQFAAAYRTENVARSSLIEWVARMATGTGVVLLCSTHEPCHRDILAELIRESLA